MPLDKESPKPFKPPNGDLLLSSVRLSVSALVFDAFGFSPDSKPFKSLDRRPDENADSLFTKCLSAGIFTEILSPGALSLPALVVGCANGVGALVAMGGKAADDGFSLEREADSLESAGAVDFWENGVGVFEGIGGKLAGETFLEVTVGADIRGWDVIDGAVFTSFAFLSSASFPLTLVSLTLANLSGVVPNEARASRAALLACTSLTSFGKEKDKASSFS
mmetsp:Transcript_30932/g.45031  ORF Transcript_30932/g.45031 Transcript_30932/m.45031 type:complete len:221 (+) Transcript_30932:649-1311(+)